MNDRLAWFVVLMVVSVWTVTTLILPLVLTDYVAPASVNAVMGSIAGGAGAYLFARRSERPRKNGRNGKKRPEKTLYERAIERGKKRSAEEEGRP